MQSVPQAAEATAMLKVMTYNIHHGRGLDRRYDLDRIARVIESCGPPDIIGLQEVDRHRRRTAGDDQAKILAERLGMHHAFARVVDASYDASHPEAYYGIAILSKWPIERTEHFDLSYGARSEPRACLHAEIHVGAQPLHLFCVHLGLGRRERDYQVARLLSDEIVGNGRFGMGPKILLGDFNNWWPVKSASLVNEHFHNACHVTGRKQLRTFGNFLSLLALDYVFHSPDLTVSHCEVIKSRAARIASDHRPLVCTVAMPQAGSGISA